MRRRDVRDWVVKAEQDYEAARFLIRKRRPALNDAVSFHAHQCAEKYLKAFLVKHRVAFPKTHDLLELLELASRIDATLELLRPFLTYLLPYAVDIRYPGEGVTRPEARQAIGYMQRLRERLRYALGLR